MSSSGIIDSQVLVPARMLASWGYSCHFIGTDSTIQKAREAELRIRDEYRICATVVPRRHAKMGGLSLWRIAQEAWNDAHPLIKWNTVRNIYSRSIFSMDVLLRTRKVHRAELVFDCRGAVPFEIQQRPFVAPVYRAFLGYFEHRAVKRSDKVMCVSRSLCEYIAKRHGSIKAAVVPCCVDQEQFRFDASSRVEIRRMIGVKPDSIVLAYAGGLSHWQRIDDIAEVFGKLKKLSDRFNFIVLSNEPDKAKRKFGRVVGDQTQLTTIGVPHRDVAKYLSAADVGIILRDDTLMNQVASPVKVAEYLACGLKVLLSTGVGDYSTVLPHASTAMVVAQDLSNIEEIGKLLLECDFDAERNRAIEMAGSQFSWVAHRQTFEMIYGSIK